MQNLKIRVKDLVEMEEFANKLANYFTDHPAVIFLDGDLGAGKTTFTQFFAKELGVHEVVTSPTFNLLKRYQGEKRFLNHFDLYRIKENVYHQGFEDYWNNPDEISIIEWATYLPNEFKSLFSLHLTIKIINENEREITILGRNSIISFIKEECNELIH